jgi:hypothetical protein
VYDEPPRRRVRAQGWFVNRPFARAEQQARLAYGRLDILAQAPFGTAKEARRDFLAPDFEEQRQRLRVSPHVAFCAARLARTSPWLISPSQSMGLSRLGTFTRVMTMLI